MSYVLDSNVIIYAFSDDYAQYPVARRLLDHALTVSGMCPRQVLGELLSVAHRKHHVSLSGARAMVGWIEDSMSVIDTDSVATLAASALAERHRLQYFDALICTLAMRGGASLLFSEDMHDGLRLGSMTIVNPFAPANQALVAEAIS